MMNALHARDGGDTFQHRAGRLKPLALQLLAVALFAASGGANAATYAYTDLGTLGGTSSYARGINDVGQIVGESHITGDILHSTLWNGATAIDLAPALGPPTSSASGINSAGHTVGSRGITETTYHATL